MLCFLVLFLHFLAVFRRKSVVSSCVKPKYHVSTHCAKLWCRRHPSISVWFLLKRRELPSLSRTRITVSGYISVLWVCVVVVCVAVRTPWSKYNSWLGLYIDRWWWLSLDDNVYLTVIMIIHDDWVYFLWQRAKAVDDYVYFAIISIISVTENKAFLFMMIKFISVTENKGRWWLCLFCDD